VGVVVFLRLTITSMLRIIHGPVEFVRERLETLTAGQHRIISARDRVFLNQLYQAVNPTLWGERLPIVIRDISEALLQLPSFWEVLQGHSIELIIVTEEEPTWLIEQLRTLKIKPEVEAVGVSKNNRDQALFGLWVADLLRRHGVRVQPAAIAALTEAFAESPGALVNEVRKLAAYRPNEVIPNRELQELIRWPNESRLFALLHLFEIKDLTRFFATLKRETMLMRRPSEEFPQLLGSLHKTVAAMLLLKTAQLANAVAAVDMHHYRKRVLSQAAERFRTIELVQLYNTLAELDRRLKQSKFKHTELAEELLLAGTMKL